MANQIMITDARKAGEYFIELAKDNSLIPNTSDERKQALSDNGVDVSQFATVDVIPQQEDHLSLRVPSKEAVEAAEASLGAGAYKWPHPEIELLYKKELCPGEARPSARDLFAIRIADYSCGSCM